MKMVKIQSSITIRVTCGLQNKDVTNPDAHVADRLKVNPEWPKHQVLIRKGVFNYAEDIKAWPSVKALEKDKIITITDLGEVDESSLDEKEVENAKIVNEAKQEFKLSIDKSEESTKGRKKTFTLNELTKEG